MWRGARTNGFRKRLEGLRRDWCSRGLAFERTDVDSAPLLAKSVKEAGMRAASEGRATKQSQEIADICGVCHAHLPFLEVQGLLLVAHQKFA